MLAALALLATVAAAGPAAAALAPAAAPTAAAPPTTPPAPATPAPAPGGAAHSWYVGDLDPGRLQALGASDAERARQQRLPKSVSVLDMGDPAAEPGSTQLPDRRGLATAAQTQALMVAFARGWVATPGAPPLVLVVGTSNFGAFVDSAHGTAWGQLVGAVAGAVPPGVDVRGGLDAEPSYGTAADARAFARAYLAATDRPLVDFGDCACTPGEALPAGWTREDRAALAAAGSVLPQQYRISGIDARRWASLDDDVARIYGRRMDVLGVLTQVRACAGPPARDCGSIDQGPVEAVADLSAALGRPVRGVSDIGYLAPPPPPPTAPPDDGAPRLVVAMAALVALAGGGTLVVRRTRRRQRAAAVPVGSPE